MVEKQTKAPEEPATYAILDDNVAEQRISDAEKEKALATKLEAGEIKDVPPVKEAAGEKEPETFSILSDDEDEKRRRKAAELEAEKPSKLKPEDIIPLADENKAPVIKEEDAKDKPPVITEGEKKQPDVYALAPDPDEKAKPAEKAKDNGLKIEWGRELNSQEDKIVQEFINKHGLIGEHTGKDGKEGFKLEGLTKQQAAELAATLASGANVVAADQSKGKQVYQELANKGAEIIGDEKGQLTEGDKSYNQLLETAKKSVEELKGPAKDEAAPVKDEKGAAKDEAAPVKDKDAPVKDKDAPVKDKDAPVKDKTLEKLRGMIVDDIIERLALSGTGKEQNPDGPKRSHAPATKMPEKTAER